MKQPILILALVLGCRGLAADPVVGDPKLLYLAGLDATAGVAFGNSCGYYVTDDSNNCVKHYDVNGNLTATIAPVNNGTSLFGAPEGLDVDGQGNVWVADADNDRVEELNAAGALVMVVGSTGDAGQLSWPNDVAVGPNNRLYVADSGNNRVAVYDRSSGAFLFSWGSFGFASDPSADPLMMVSPMGLAVSNGSVLVADSGNSRVQIFSVDGAYQQTLGGQGSGAGKFDSPYDVVVDGAGRIWVADNGAQAVQIFSSSGAFLAGIGLGFDGFDFQDLTHLYAEPDGDVVVADGYANRFFIWDSTVAGMRVAPKGGQALAAAPLTVGPVPAHVGQALQLILPAPADKVTWQLYTADMRLAGVTQASGQSSIAYTQTADLAAGVYIARVVLENAGSRRESIQKIVIIQ